MGGQKGRGRPCRNPSGWPTRDRGIVRKSLGTTKKGVGFLHFTTTWVDTLRNQAPGTRHGFRARGAFPGEKPPGGCGGVEADFKNHPIRFELAKRPAHRAKDWKVVFLSSIFRPAFPRPACIPRRHHLRVLRHNSRLPGHHSHLSKPNSP